MIQKILYWENFLKMFQNGPIRKVIMKKVIFEDYLIFSPAVGHPGSTLRKYWKIFSKNRRSAIVITCFAFFVALLCFGFFRLESNNSISVILIKLIQTMTI